MEYEEFLKLPEIEEAFEERFTERKKYFREKCLRNNGFDKEHLEMLSMKMSLIENEIYFTEIHKVRNH